MTGRKKKSNTPNKNPWDCSPTMSSLERWRMRVPPYETRERNNKNTTIERKLNPALLSSQAIPPKVTTNVSKYTVTTKNAKNPFRFLGRETSFMVFLSFSKVIFITSRSVRCRFSALEDFTLMTNASKKRGGMVMLQPMAE